MNHILNSLVTIFSTIIGVIVAESLLAYFYDMGEDELSNSERSDL